MIKDNLNNMNKNGKLYGIGVGPGDPELLTLKAVSVLQKIDVVAVPESKKDKGSIALDIARSHLKENVEILTLTFPMTNDDDVRNNARMKNSLLIKNEVEKGKAVAFLTLGDPLFYSTYIYVLENLSDSDIDIETIPGVPAFCAISAKLNIPLAKQEETLGIIPLNENSDVENLISTVDNAVIMKVSSDSSRLADILENYEDSISVNIISDCGSEDERILTTIKDLRSKVPYLTTAIIKKN